MNTIKKICLLLVMSAIGASTAAAYQQCTWNDTGSEEHWGGHNSKSECDAKHHGSCYQSCTEVAPNYPPAYPPSYQPNYPPAYPPSYYPPQYPSYPPPHGPHGPHGHNPPPYPGYPPHYPSYPSYPGPGYPQQPSYPTYPTYPKPITCNWFDTGSEEHWGGHSSKVECDAKHHGSCYQSCN